MLYIMRHGKTLWNEEHRLQGRTDVALSDKGREMAAAAAVRDASVHFDVCYCSPLVRALETARIYLEGRDVPIIIDDRLKEMCYGIYEGTANSFSIPDCPINTLFFEPQNYTTPAEGAESIEELSLRTGEFLDEIALPQSDAGKSVLIVAHGAVNSSIICRVRQLPVKDFWSAGIENCKLMRLI